MDPRLEQLWRTQAKEEKILFDSFINANPSLEIDVEDYEWPEEKTAEYEELVRGLREEHETQCEALITILESEM